MSKLKRIPFLVILAIVLILILGTVALASVTISRSGHVSRTLSQQMSVSANQDLVIPLDGTSGTVDYTVTNPGPVPYSVTVSPTCDSGMSILSSDTTFSLGVGLSKVVTLTITFTDPAMTDGDYSVEFQAA